MEANSVIIIMLICISVANLMLNLQLKSHKEEIGELRRDIDRIEQVIKYHYNQDIFKQFTQAYLNRIIRDKLKDKEVK